MEIPSGFTGIERDPVLQVAHSLPTTATLLMIKQMLREAQSAVCLESLKWAICSGVKGSPGWDMIGRDEQAVATAPGI